MFSEGSTTLRLGYALAASRNDGVSLGATGGTRTVEQGSEGKAKSQSNSFFLGDFLAFFLGGSS